MKGYYDIKANAHALPKGTFVWLHNPKRKKGISPKLSRPWEGPYLVTQKWNDVIYSIQRYPKSKQKIVHRNRLWLYRGTEGTELSSWLLKEPASESKHEGASIIPDEATHPVGELTSASKQEEASVVADGATRPTEEPGLRKSKRRRKKPARYSPSQES